MEIPEENKVCHFCRWAAIIDPSLSIIWCKNSKVINERRARANGTKRISNVDGETRFSSSSCHAFEERKGAAQELVKLKLTGKYKVRDHERRTGGTITSG